MPNRSKGWWSSVGCDSFGDETYEHVKMSGDNVRGRNERGRNVGGSNIRGCIVPEPVWIG
jgi:hypothetical protein